MAESTGGAPRRGRTGGLAAQVVFALAHTATHLAAAVLALVLLELGVETCIRRFLLHCWAHAVLGPRVESPYATCLVHEWMSVVGVLSPPLGAEQPSRCAQLAATGWCVNCKRVGLACGCYMAQDAFWLPLRLTA